MKKSITFEVEGVVEDGESFATKVAEALIQHADYILREKDISLGPDGVQFTENGCRVHWKFNESVFEQNKRVLDEIA